MKRDNHYEVAFESYLRARKVGYVAVNEAKRSPTAEGEPGLKSVDFIVLGQARLVVDVKGRRFPGGSRDTPRLVWQNWATESDLDGLARWAAHLGPDYRGILAFVYHIGGAYSLPDGTPDLFEYGGSQYLARAIPAADYTAAMRRRSKKWGTVHLPTAEFRRLVRPFSSLLAPQLVPESSRP